MKSANVKLYYVLFSIKVAMRQMLMCTERCKELLMLFSCCILVSFFPLTFLFFAVLSELSVYSSFIHSTLGVIENAGYIFYANTILYEKRAKMQYCYCINCCLIISGNHFLLLYTYLLFSLSE